MILNALRSYIVSAYNCKDTQRFPAALPVSMTRKDLYNITNINHSSEKCMQYVCTTKVDGERSLLVSLLIDSSVTTFSVNRAWSYCAIGDIELPQSTILDVEMLSDGTIWVFDAIQIGGCDVKKYAYHHRWKYAEELLKSLNESDTVIRMKPFFTTTLPPIGLMPSDGFIFYPVSLPVQPYTNNELFKWKPTSIVTVDFRISNDGKCYVTDDYGRETCVEQVPIECEYGNRVYECYPTFIVDTIYWNVKCIRNDKKSPNSKYVYEKSLLNIRENITYEELEFLWTVKSHGVPKYHS